MRALVAVLMVMIGSFFLLLWTACIGMPVTVGGIDAPVEVVTLSPANSSLLVGESMQLNAVPMDVDGNILSDRVIVWFTANPAIAMVSPTGVVTGVSPGAVTVAALSEGRTGTAGVIIVQPTVTPVASVDVTPATATVVIGQTVQLTATPKDAGGTPLTGRSVTWASSNAAIGTVTTNGLVSGVTPGTITVAATSEGKTGLATITVTTVPVATVEVSPSSASILVGTTTALSAVTKDAQGNVLSGRPIAWSSSNASVATVNGSGVVTGVGAGSATITATSEGRSATAAITVSPAPVSSVEVSPSAASVTVGATRQLTAILKDAHGNVLTGRSITWSSSNSSIATVNASGLVTGIAVGSATITAVSEGVSGTAALTVSSVPVATVEVSPSSTSIQIGATTQLSAATRDASGNVLTGRTVVWSSSNTAVATVNSTGLVTGVAAGSVTITASSEGKSGTATVVVTQPAVATVTVSPSSASLLVGATTQLSVELRDAQGNVLTGRTVTWSSSATGVATVNSNGVVTGVSSGSATITATSEGRTGTASVAVTSAPTAPGNVTDLAVANIGSNSVTLSFTEVDDGTGSPASYDVRFAPAPLSWGSAAHVYQGTCSLPVLGTVIGAKRTCTVLGLATSTAYQFQLVSYRGTLDVNAVFGALSNVASATTGTSSAPVASVTLSPSTSTIGVGRTQQFTAVLKDASGNTITGRPITWSSSNTAIATISTSGLVTGLAEGSTTVRATSEGVSGTANVTVTALAASTWPNEPSGMTVVRDAPFNLVTAAGWSQAYNEDNLATIVGDGSAPHSPSNVLQFRYPQGFVGGTAPATIYSNPGDAKEYFVGLWWKPSNPWHGHSSNINKIMFFFTASWADAVVTMHGPNGGPYYVRVVTQGMPSSGTYMTQNVNVVPVVLGKWHRIELYMKYDSYYGAKDGVIKWWVDGVLVGHHTGLGFPNDSGFREFQLSPTWGGLNGSKAQTDYFWYDHVYLSRR